MYNFNEATLGPCEAINSLEAEARRKTEKRM